MPGSSLPAAARARPQGIWLLVALLGGLAAAADALAWNAGGHRMTAAIAWQQLDTATRARVAALLATHPDYPHWQARRPRGGDDPAAAFAEAATWADNIRSAAAFHDPDETATPLRPGFPDMLRRRDWHYVNQILGERTIAGGTLHHALPGLYATLSDRDSARRAYALVWLLHLVGDLHQPLHVATRRGGGSGSGRRASHDGGGNAVAVLLPEGIPGQRRRTLTTNLHALWDDLPGPSWLAGERLAASARRLLRETPAPPDVVACNEALKTKRPTRNCARVPDFAGWRAETHALASAAYAGVGDATGGEPSPFRLDGAYLGDSRRIAEAQVARAGYRLALLLRASLRE